MGFLAAIPAAIGTMFAASATTAEVAAAGTTLLTAATVASVAAGGYAAYGTYEQGKYQSSVAKANAKIAGENRESALIEGADQASIERTNTGRRVGAALAAQGASGLDVGFGTGTELRGALQNEGDLDAMTIQYNTSRRALGYAQQASNFSADAQFAGRSATGALVGGALNTGRSVLGGAAAITSNRLKFTTAGGSFTGS